MARQPDLIPAGGLSALVRLAEPETANLWQLLFHRYPRYEWATFARFGWRETPDGLVVTLASLDPATPGELDDEAPNVVIREPYTLRIALAAEHHPLAVGIIHSHPEGYRTEASEVDDDMDDYFADYFEGFAPTRPYVSLILARDGTRLSATGRVFWCGRWRAVERFAIENEHATIGGYSAPLRLSDAARARVARLESAFGLEAAERLAGATVAVVGAGGTGSPALEVLARAGVGHLITVDPDVFDDSNLERIHGSGDQHVGQSDPKVSLAREHIKSINPSCRVTAIKGRLPQPEVIDALVHADVVIGCTDKYHSRLALSDLATRYLVPAIDCGVVMEGGNGRVTGQVIQLVRFLPADACALCRRMINSTRLTQELMSEEERAARRAAARRALAEGLAGGAYWDEEPQLNTVGYLTTAAGALAAGYAIGWLTGRFDPPFERLQMNLAQEFLDVTDSQVEPRQTCACRKMRGTADQGSGDALVTPPQHWPPAERT